MAAAELAALPAPTAVTSAPSTPQPGPPLADGSIVEVELLTDLEAAQVAEALLGAAAPAELSARNDPHRPI